MTPRISTQALWRSFRRMLSVLVLLLLIGLATSAAVMVQAGRSDATSADAALVMLGDERGAAVRLDRALQLYLAGKVSRLVLLGPSAPAHREALLARGVQPEAVTFFDQGHELDQIAAAKQQLDQDGLASTILVAEPVESLRLLKQARDDDMQPSNLPVGASGPIEIGGVLREVGRYYRYVLFND